MTNDEVDDMAHELASWFEQRSISVENGARVLTVLVAGVICSMATSAGEAQIVARHVASAVAKRVAKNMQGNQPND